jgi:hypothetical protein
VRNFTTRALTGASLTAGLVLLGGTAAIADEAHEVQPGDTLSSIAAGTDQADTWRDVAAVNDLDDPDLIFPGTVLSLTGDAAPASAEPAPEPAPEPEPTTADTGVWDRLAECESSGDWSINTGNGYYGGLQFLPSSWEAAGGTGMPHEASRETQIAVAENLLEMQGWGAWPACADQLGLR